MFKMFNIEKTLKKTILRFTRAEQIKQKDFEDWLEDKIDEIIESESKNEFYSLMSTLENEIKRRKDDRELNLISIRIQKEILKKIQEYKKDK